MKSLLLSHSTQSQSNTFKPDLKLYYLKANRALLSIIRNLPTNHCIVCKSCQLNLSWILINVISADESIQTECNSVLDFSTDVISFSLHSFRLKSSLKYIVHVSVSGSGRSPQSQQADIVIFCYFGSSYELLFIMRHTLLHFLSSTANYLHLYSELCRTVQQRLHWADWGQGCLVIAVM